MENKKGNFAGIHRDGYTWKDSMIVSILVFFMMFIGGTGIGLLIGKIIHLFSNEDLETLFLKNGCSKVKFMSVTNHRVMVAYI